MSPTPLRIVSSAVSALVLAAFLFVLPLAAEEAASPFAGHWEGTIETPSTPLEIDIDLEASDDGLAGDISIPVQGIEDYALSGVETEDGTIRFRMEGIPGTPSFEGDLSDDGTAIRGTFTQGGASLEFSLTSVDAAATARDALGGFGAVVEQALADFDVPGAAIAVVAGGEVVFADGFGYRDVENEKPMTADTLFAIGSTTKAMTSTLLGMLVAGGQIEWDDPVRDVLPDFALADPSVSHRVTVRDLVTHRTGMPRHDALWYNNNEITRAELIGRFEHLELTADLRQEWQYNNLMYMTAGHLAARVDGTTWEEMMRRRLFDSLGMERSNTSVQASQEDPDHALPYDKDGDVVERIPFRVIDVVGPAGSVNSSVREMTRWLLFNLEGGRVGDVALLDRSVLDQVHAVQIPVPMDASHPEILNMGYAHGWLASVYRGHRLLSHPVGIDGFTTSVAFLPDDGVGVVAFTNRPSALPALLSRKAMDRILGLEDVDWLGDALAEQEKGEAAQEEAEEKKDALRVADTAPSHEIDEYVGAYEHAGYGVMEIRRPEAADGHGLEMVYNGIVAPLEHWHYDVWNGAETEGDPTFVDSKVLFRSGFDGQIESLVAPFEPAASPAVFERRADPRLRDPEYLQRFTGTYELKAAQQVARVALQGESLTVDIAGQPTYTLVPEASGRFGLEGLSGFSVAFEENEAGEVTRMVFYQPNGVFEAERVEE